MQPLVITATNVRSEGTEWVPQIDIWYKARAIETSLQRHTTSIHIEIAAWTTPSLIRFLILAIVYRISW